RFVARARMHRLRERFIDTADENEELRIGALEVLLRPSVERAGLVDRMDDGPAQRKKDHLRTLELELGIAATTAIEARELYLGLELHELIAPRVRDAEHESGLAVIGRDDRHVAEQERRRGPRKAREHEPSE